MALELASRALGAEPVIGQDGSVTLAGYRVPSSVKGTLTLNFDGGAADVRTYSLADLRACVEKDDKEFFRQFADKIVIFGTLLDAEDRKLTSKRFATGIEESAAPRCALPPAKAGTRYARSTIAGVYIHATAVNNLLARDALIEFERKPTIAMAIGFALLTALAAWMLAPAAAAATYVGLVALTALGATYAFSKAYVIPLSEPFIAGLLALLSDDRLAAGGDRPRPAAAAQEFRALSGAAGDRPHARLQQAAGSRRRDARRHRVLFRSRRLFLDRREDVADRAGRLRQ